MPCEIHQLSIITKRLAEQNYNDKSGLPEIQKP